MQTSVAVRLQRQLDERRGRRDAAPFGVRGQAALRLAVVAGRAGRQHVAARAGPGEAGAPRPRRSAAPGVAASRSASKLLLHRAAAELAPGRDCASNGVRLWSPNRTPTPRAVVCGRTQPPSVFSSLAKPTTRRNSSGRRSDWVRPKVTGRPERRDTSPIQATSARVPDRSSPSRSPRRDGALEHAPPVPAQHVGDGVQLVGVAHVPGTGRPSGTRVQQRPRRGEAERPGLHGLVDQLAPSPRCRRPWPAPRPGCARPWRGGAPRSGRPSRPRSGPWGGGRCQPGTRRRSTQSQGSPSRMASRGMSSTLSIISAR